MEPLDPEMLAEVLSGGRKPPRVLHTNVEHISYETEKLHPNKVVELSSGAKVVITYREITSVTRELTVREYDPDNMYEDLLHEFTLPNEEGGD